MGGYYEGLGADSPAVRGQWGFGGEAFNDFIDFLTKITHFRHI